MWGCTCACRYTHYVHVCRVPRLMLDVFLNRSFRPEIFREGLLLKPELAVLASLAGQLAPGSPGYCLPDTKITRELLCPPGFYTDSGDLHLVFTLAHQVLYPHELSPALPFFYRQLLSIWWTLESPGSCAPGNPGQGDYLEYIIWSEQIRLTCGWDCSPILGCRWRRKLSSTHTHTLLQTAEAMRPAASRSRCPYFLSTVDSTLDCELKWALPPPPLPSSLHVYCQGIFITAIGKEWKTNTFAFIKKIRWT